MITLYDSLESVLTYFCDNVGAMEDGTGPMICTKFYLFKYIYILYFWSCHLAYLVNVILYMEA